MSPKERVLAVIKHNQTDVVPYNIKWDDGVREAFAKWCGNNKFDNEVINHFVFVGAGARRTELSDSEYIDDWGCRFKQGNIFHLLEPMLPEPHIRNYKFPDLSEPWRYENLEKTISENQDKFIIAVYYGGMFERGWMMRGMENWLMDMVEHEAFVNELLDGIFHVLLTFVDVMSRYSGIDAIMLGDDYGQQRGLMMNPVTWRKFFKPRLAHLFKRIHEHGKYTAIHSCGDNSTIMDDFVEIGLDIFNPFQPEAMDIVEIKRRYGSRITFNGGIGTQGKLVHGSPEEVRQEIQFVLKQIGDRGGLIAETSKPLRHEVPMQNIAALIDELSHQKRKMI